MSDTSKYFNADGSVDHDVVDAKRASKEQEAGFIDQIMTNPLSMQMSGGAGYLLKAGYGAMKARNQLKEGADLPFGQDFMAGLGTGMFGGLADEAEGVRDTLVEGGSLAENVEANAAGEDLAREAGGIGFTIGEITGMLTPGALLAKGLTKATGSALSLLNKKELGRATFRTAKGRIVASSAIAGAEGGAYAAAEGDNIVQGAGLGIIGGAALSSIFGEAISSVLKKLGTKRVNGDEILRDIGTDLITLMQKNGTLEPGQELDIELLQQALAAAGPNATLLDVVPELIPAAAKLSKSGKVGSGAENLRNIVRARAAPEFAEEHLAKIVEALSARGPVRGPREFKADADATLKELRSGYSELFSKADVDGVAFDKTYIKDVLNAALAGRGRTSAVEALEAKVNSFVKRRVAKNKKELGDPVLLARDVQDVREEIDNLVSDSYYATAGDKGAASTSLRSMAGVVADMRQVLGQDLETAMEGFADFNKAYRSVVDSKNAYAKAGDMLADTELSSEDLLTITSDLQARGMDPAEALFEGLAHKIISDVGNSSDVTAIATRLSQPSVARKNLRLILGNDVAQNLEDAVVQYANQRGVAQALGEVSSEELVKNQAGPLQSLLDLALLGGAGTGTVSTAAGLGAARRGIADLPASYAGGYNEVLARLLGAQGNEAQNMLTGLAKARQNPTQAELAKPEFYGVLGGLLADRFNDD